MILQDWTWTTSDSRLLPWKWKRGESFPFPTILPQQKCCSNPFSNPPVRVHCSVLTSIVKGGPVVHVLPRGPSLLLCCGFCCYSICTEFLLRKRCHFSQQTQMKCSWSPACCLVRGGGGISSCSFIFVFSDASSLKGISQFYVILSLVIFNFRLYWTSMNCLLLILRVKSYWGWFKWTWTRQGGSTPSSRRKVKRLSTA